MPYWVHKLIGGQWVIQFRTETLEAAREAITRENAICHDLGYPLSDYRVFYGDRVVLSIEPNAIKNMGDY